MSIEYAVGQSIRFANDPDKVAKWHHVVAGMQSGLLTIGSRTPITNTPAWATPEVTSSGFATGALCAGGELRSYEQALADQARSLGFDATEMGDANDSDTDSSLAATRATRAAANQFLIEHEQGLLTLLTMLHSQCYRVRIPEEGCLLVYAWLCEHKYTAEAQTLLREILPFFSRLRFHPEPSAEPEDTSIVALATALDARIEIATRGECKYTAMADLLATRGLGPRLERWYALREQILALWIETLDDPALPPTGTWLPMEGAPCPKFVLCQDSSKPGQQFPAGWCDRAAAVVAEFDDQQTQSIGRKQRRNYKRLVDLADRVCHRGTDALSREDITYISFRIATASLKRGLPGSAAYSAWRDAVETNRSRCATAIAADRQLHTQAVERIDAISQTTNVLSEDDAKMLKAELTAAFPTRKRTNLAINRAVERAVGMTLAQVFARSKSLEVVAALLPKFSAAVRSPAIADPALRYLYEQILVAFAARRSLLLLNYSYQVRVAELPWVRAIETLVIDPAMAIPTDQTQTQTQMTENERPTALALQSATTAFTRLIVVQALQRFGEVPLCNPFVRELGALLQAARVGPCPLVEEIAADIFMGSFTPKFTRAYEAAQLFLSGTVYQTYYNIEPPATTSQSLDTMQFAALCRTRAGLGDGANCWSVSTNARVIEQCQLLTTHNLATLFVVFELHKHLDEINVPAILKRCWCEIQRLAALLVTPHVANDWRVRGQTQRYIGYTWRQMLFFFAVLEKFEHEAFRLAIDAMCAVATEVESPEYRAHLLALAETLRSGTTTTTNSSTSSSGGQERPSYVLAWGL